MSEKETQVWVCLNPDCKKKMDFLDMKYVNLNGKCPYCYCMDFKVQIYELKRDLKVIKPKMTDDEIMRFNEEIMAKIHKREVQPLEDLEKKEKENKGVN